MENRSRNVDRRRVLYIPVDIVGERGETLGEGVESLHNLCGIHLRILIEVMRWQSLFWRCWKVGLY